LFGHEIEVLIERLIDRSQQGELKTDAHRLTAIVGAVPARDMRTQWTMQGRRLFPGEFNSSPIVRPSGKTTNKLAFAGRPPSLIRPRPLARRAGLDRAPAAAFPKKENRPMKFGESDGKGGIHKGGRTPGSRTRLTARVFEDILTHCVSDGGIENGPRNAIMDSGNR
jgi:hypothetical protein